MPYVVTALANALVSYGWGQAAATAIATISVYVGSTLVLTAAAKALAPSVKRPKNIFTTEYFGTVEARRVIYGQRRVSGMNVIPPISSGLKGDDLHQVLALAGHECDSLVAAYIDGGSVALANIGAITGADTDGAVSGTTRYDGFMNIRFYNGSQTTADYILTNSTTLTSDFVGRGICYAAIRFKYDDKAYYTGKAEMAFEVKGKRVYDPRLDSTNGGTGSHRLATPATWEWSRNPALCLADYLRDDTIGMGEDDARVDWALVAAAANICDEVLSLENDLAQSIYNGPRYASDYVFEVTEDYKVVIESFCNSMMGHCAYSGGQWRIYAGAWSASSFTLTEDDLVGSVSVQANLPRNEMYNAVRGQYSDELTGLPKEFAPRTSATYESDDGERIFREIDLPAVSNEYRAQLIGTLIGRLSRYRQAVVAEFALTAFKVRPFDVGTVTISEIGWVAQTCRCTKWALTPSGTVQLTLRQEDANLWTDPADSDYDEVVAAVAPTTTDFVPATPTSLTAVSVTNGVLLSWTYGDVLPGTFFEIWRYTASTPWSSATRIGTTAGTTYIDAETDGRTWYYWVRAGHTSGTFSATEPTTTGLGAARNVTFVHPDPDITLSATQGVYWDWSVTGAATVSLSSTGGVSGGVIAVNFGSGGASDAARIWAVRPTYRAVTGDYFEIVLRFRRTSAVTGGTYHLAPSIGLSASADFGSPSSSIDAICIWDGVNSETTSALGFLTGTQINAYTINQWQEWRCRYRLQNNPKSSTQRPYLYVSLGTNTLGSGTIEIDAFDVFEIDDNREKDGLEIGYRAVPITTQDGTYTFALSDNGKTVRHTSASAHTWTIPANATVAFPAGAVITLEAGASSGNVTITPATGVGLELAGTASTGSRTLAANGLATILKTATNTWKISGAGVT